MGSPVAVGDVILLSQMAFKIGQAFTSSRKSAPAEFGDVQRLLFTLKSALNLVAENLPKDKDGSPSPFSSASSNGKFTSDGNGTPQASEVLSEILKNCRTILEHLQNLVDKYLEIDPQETSQGGEARPGFKRWKDDFRRNWKKVKWTTEGGGLDKLTTTLSVHISGVDLALAALTKQQVSSVDAKLEEIYQWFKTNLQERPVVTTAAATPNHNNSRMPSPLKPRLTFAIWLEAAENLERSLCCRSASFSHGWLEAGMDTHFRRPIFQCHCDHSCHFQDMPCTEPQIHHWGLDFSLLHVSLFVRMAEPTHQREWQMYVKSTSHTQEVSIVINNVPPANMGDFEHQASLLAASQAQSHLFARSNTMLVTMSVANMRGVVSVLNMKSSSAVLSDDIVSVSFMSNGRSFTPERIESIQLLHHRLIHADVLQKQPPGATADMLRDHPYAELVIHSVPSTTFGEEVSYSVRLEPDTPVIQGETERHVCFKDVVCIEEPSATSQHASASTSPKEILCSAVVLKFRSPTSANSALHTVHSMRSELQISWLREAQWGEHIVLQRPEIRDVDFPPFHLTSASLNIIYNPSQQRYRLILLSGCRSLCVCVELSAEFVDTLRRSRKGDVDANTENDDVQPDEEDKCATSKESDMGDMTAWFVQIGRDGASLFRRQSKGTMLLALGGSLEVQGLLIDVVDYNPGSEIVKTGDERSIEDADGLAGPALRRLTLQED